MYVLDDFFLPELQLRISRLGFRVPPEAPNIFSNTISATPQKDHAQPFPPHSPSCIPGQNCLRQKSLSIFLLAGQ
jgi:hypothetical protein